MSKSNANNPSLFIAFLGTVSTAGTYPLLHLPKNFIVTGARVTDQAGIAADNTNYVTLTLKKGSTAIASYDTRAANQGALTANVAGAMVLDAAIAAGLVANGAKSEIPAGDYTMVYAEGGTGTTTLMQVQLEGYWK